MTLQRHSSTAADSSGRHAGCFIAVAPSVESDDCIPHPNEITSLAPAGSLPAKPSWLSADNSVLFAHTAIRRVPAVTSAELASLQARTDGNSVVLTVA